MSFVGLVLATTALQAANKTWDGGGADDNWNTAANWNGNTNPANTDDIFLGSAFTSGTTISLNGAARTMNSFTIDTTSNFTISTQTGTITSGNLNKTSASSGLQTIASGIALTNAGTWAINGSGTVALSGVISGAGGFTKTGTGTVLLSAGANTYAGNTTLNSGTVVLDYTNAGNKFGGGNGVITLGGASLVLTNGATTENNDSTVIAAGHSSVSRGAGTSILQTDVITRNIGGSVNFGANGIATTDSTNTNGILGAWATVSGTTWAFNSTDGNNGAINGLTTFETSTTQTNWATTENISLAANPTANVTTRAINSLRFTAATTFTMATNNTGTITSGGIMSVGTGATVITGGTLKIAAAATDFIVYQNASADMTINSILADATGPDGLTKSGTGRLILGGANTYTGQTYVNQGILSISSNANLGAVGTGAAVNLDGGTLQATANVTLNNAGANHRNVTLADNGGTLDVAASSTLTITGTVTGAGHLNKTGAGTVVMSGSNNYTGQTTISAGTFFINGNQANATGAVNVVSSGTLGGTGTVGGAVTIGSGATLAVGQSPGVQTFNSNLTFSDPNSKVIMEIAGTTRGTTYDGANISGVLTYGGDLTLAITGVIADGTYDLFQINGSQTGNFDSIVLGGSYSGSLASLGGGVWSLESGGKTFTFTQSTGDLVVVPEPAMLGMLGAGLGFVFLRARRRSKSDLENS